jgi:hypothetical protein
VAAYLTHLFGGTEPASPEAVPELIAELDRADGEHTDVSIEDESGWGLSAYATGLLVWENVEGDEPPMQLSGVSRERMIELFTDFVAGRRDAVASQPWVARV